MQTIDFRVSPIEGGWILDSSGGLEPLIFRSGGQAEAKAEALAQAMTAAGVDVRLAILDRAGQTIGTKRFWAREPAGAQPDITDSSLAPA